MPGTEEIQRCRGTAGARTCGMEFWGFGWKGRDATNNWHLLNWHAIIPPDDRHAMGCERSG